MYLDFYGFREKPFNLTPDPRFVYLSKNHREAFAHLLYGINNRAGFILLTGEVGSGKTTVLRALLNHLNADRYRTALIFNPCLTAPELIQDITREFAIRTPLFNQASLLNALNVFLLQQNAEGRTVVLVIDEAQNLELPVLEQIRLISNLETDTDKLIQIVLAGQPEFLQVLKRREVRQLNQRITVRCHLYPMDLEDTAAYVNHRLRVAGGRDGVIFSNKALKRIYKYSGGLPRLVNSASDRALLVGYARDATKIGSRISALGIKDVKEESVSRGSKRRFILILALVMVAALFVTGIYIKDRDSIHPLIPLQNVEKMGDPVKENSHGAGEALAGAVAAELGKIPEPESARKAFNTLAGVWNVPPVPEGDDFDPLTGMDRAALSRDLRVYRFSGNLGVLLRVGYPAVLELNIPGIQGNRFLSLIGMKKDQLLVESPISGKNFLSFTEIEKHWSGRGFLLWKDFLNLLMSTPPGSKGEPVKRLQDLLREAGVYNKPSTGIYDSDTITAIKEFQSSRGIEQDGILGRQTLMLLYRSVSRFEVPKFTGGQK